MLLFDPHAISKTNLAGWREVTQEDITRLARIEHALGHLLTSAIILAPELPEPSRDYLSAAIAHAKQMVEGTYDGAMPEAERMAIYAEPLPDIS